MLMYPLHEAISLLSGKLVAAKRNLEETIEDLEWLREQSTVMEVNFARVHNVRLPLSFLPTPLPLLGHIATSADLQWDVKRRRDLKARGETEEKEEKE